MSIELCCPDCGHVILAEPQRAGRSVLCPGCQRPLRVPQRSEPSPRGAPTQTLCPRCGAKIRIAASLLGRQIACNTCRAHLMVSLTVTEVASTGLVAPAAFADDEPALVTPEQAAPKAGTAAAESARAKHKAAKPVAGQASAASTESPHQPLADEPEFTVTAVLESEDASPPARRIPPWAVPAAITGALACIALVVFINSGDILDKGRRPVGGAILGAELQHGEITFEPVGPPDRPTATTTFGNGRYQFDGNNGPAAGLYRVSVKFASQPPGSPGVSVPAVVPEDKPYELDINIQ